MYFISKNKTLFVTILFLLAHTASHALPSIGAALKRILVPFDINYTPWVYSVAAQDAPCSQSVSRDIHSSRGHENHRIEVRMAINEYGSGTLITNNDKVCSASQNTLTYFCGFNNQNLAGKLNVICPYGKDCPGSHERVNLEFPDDSTIYEPKRSLAGILTSNGTNKHGIIGDRFSLNEFYQWKPADHMVINPWKRAALVLYWAGLAATAYATYVAYKHRTPIKQKFVNTKNWILKNMFRQRKAQAAATA